MKKAVRSLVVEKAAASLGLQAADARACARATWKDTAEQRLDGAKLDAADISKVGGIAVLDPEVRELAQVDTRSSHRVEIGNRQLSVAYGFA